MRIMEGVMQICVWTHSTNPTRMLSNGAKRKHTLPLMGQTQVSGRQAKGTEIHRLLRTLTPNAEKQHNKLKMQYS